MSINEIKNYQRYLKGRIDFNNTNRELLDKLVSLSIDCGFSLQITSSFRTPELNRTCGGSPTSSHLKGLAVDIVCTESNKRLVLVYYVVKHGFARIGVYDKHIHLDIDHSKPAALWLGKSN